MAKLTDGKKTVVVVALSENEELNANVADHPIETGVPITDHSQLQSKTLSLSGWLKGDNQSKIDGYYSTLQSWITSGTRVSWQGAARNKNFVMTRLSKTYDDGGFKNAIKIELDLKVVWTAKSSFTKNTYSGKKQVVTPPKPAAVYYTVQPGATYWWMSQKWGTSIPQLRSWNKWPDRFIPIGVRARVK